MKVVSRVGCKHLQGSISNVTISKQDHKKDIHVKVQGQPQNYIRPNRPDVRLGCPRYKKSGNR